MNDRELTIGDQPAASRYEARLGDELVGIVDYRRYPERITLVHTEVLPEHEGRGIASRLARFALEDARRRGLLVRPSCPYVAAYLQRHPEYADLIYRPKSSDSSDSSA